MRITATLSLLLPLAYLPALVAQDAKSPHYIRAGHLIVARVEASNTFSAYSTKSGKWASHTFPDGIEATPVASNHCVAFQLSGESLTELVAVDENGTWRVHKLTNPAKGGCLPYLGQSLMYCVADGHTHAFSATHGKWDSLAAVSTVPVQFDSLNGKAGMEVILVVSPTSISAFSAQCPTWATVTTSPARGG